jgi:hypothetical protein
MTRQLAFPYWGMNMAGTRKLKAQSANDSINPGTELKTFGDHEQSKDWATLLKEDVLNKLNPVIQVRPNVESIARIEAARNTTAAKTIFYIFDCAEKEEALSKNTKEFRGVVCSLHKEDIYDYHYLFDTTSQLVEDKLFSENAATIKVMQRKPRNVYKWREEDQQWNHADITLENFLQFSVQEYKETMNTFDSAQWAAIERYVLNESAGGKKAAKGRDTGKKQEGEGVEEKIIAQLELIKTEITEALAKDVKSFTSRHPGENPDSVTKHIIATVKDLIATMPVISGEANPPPVPKVMLLYKNDLNNMMKAVKKHAYALGYHGWALSHIQLNFNAQPELVALPKPPRRDDDSNDRSDSPTKRLRPGSDTSDSEDLTGSSKETDTTDRSSDPDSPASSPQHLLERRNSVSSEESASHELSPAIIIPPSPGNRSRTTSSPSPVQRSSSPQGSPPPQEFLQAVFLPLKDMLFKNAKSPLEIAQGFYDFKKACSTPLIDLARLMMSMCREERVSDLKLEQIMFAFLGLSVEREAADEVEKLMIMLADSLNKPIMDVAQKVCEACAVKKIDSTSKKHIILNFLALHLERTEKVEDITKLIVKFSQLLGIQFKEAAEIGLQKVAPEKQTKVMFALLDKAEQRRGSTGEITSGLNSSPPSSSSRSLNKSPRDRDNSPPRGGSSHSAPSSASTSSSYRERGAGSSIRGSATMYGSSSSARGGASSYSSTGSAYRSDPNTPYRIRKESKF